MTGLQEGHNYSLSTEVQNNKSIIFVKLTDSAVQSIEALLNLKDALSSKPTIQFQSNSGVISLPLNGRNHNYGFTLSNIEGGGTQSSFQCLQQTDASCLESLGFMLMKMQIHATEDSYEKTKSKMTAAEQEQKNLCTKELQSTVSRLGANKVNVKRPGLMHVPQKTQSNFVKPEAQKFNSTNKVISPSKLIQQPIRERIIHILAAKSYKKAELLLRLKREGINDKDKDLINSVLLDVAKVKGNIFILENHIWNEVREDWQFGSIEELQLIKKRKQQYVKPTNVNGVTSYSHKQKNLPSHEIDEKPCNKKQRKSLNGAQNDNKFFQKDLHISNNNVLTNGSTVGTTERSFSINGNGNLNGLSEFGNQISLLFDHKKGLPVNNNDYSESNGNMQVLKTQTSAASNKITPLQTSFVPQAHGNEDKNSKHEDKMVLENGHDYHDPRTSNAVSVSRQPSAVSVCKQTAKKNVSRPQVKRSNSSENLSVLDKIQLYKRLLNDCSSPPHKKINKKGNKSNDSSSEILPLIESASQFDFPEIQLKYTKVTTLEQRTQYVEDFDAEYDEYFKLHNQMLEIANKFSDLHHRLSSYTKESIEFKIMKVEIGKECKRILQSDFAASRKKFEFLRAKLSHIKKLILEFDKSELDEV